MDSSPKAYVGGWLRSGDPPPAFRLDSWPAMVLIGTGWQRVVHGLTIRRLARVDASRNHHTWKATPAHLVLVLTSTGGWPTARGQADAARMTLRDTRYTVRCLVRSFRPVQSRRLPIPLGTTRWAFPSHDSLKARKIRCHGRGNWAKQGWCCPRRVGRLASHPDPTCLPCCQRVRGLTARAARSFGFSARNRKLGRRSV